MIQISKSRNGCQLLDIPVSASAAVFVRHRYGTGPLYSGISASRWLFVCNMGKVGNRNSGRKVSPRLLQPQGCLDGNKPRSLTPIQRLPSPERMEIAGSIPARSACILPGDVASRAGASRFSFVPLSHCPVVSGAAIFNSQGANK